MISLFDPPPGARGARVAAPDVPPTSLSATQVENEFVQDVYADVSGWYDLFFGPTLQTGRLDAIRRLPLAAGDEVLEVGVGTGLNAVLYPEACRVTGIDFSAKMLHRAKRRVDGRGMRHVRLMQMDAAQLQFEDESFDLVYAPYVISVVPDPIRVIHEMYRVCRVGGHVVLLNHFRSENAVLSRAERLISPLTVHIGFRSDLDLSRLLAQIDIAPISIEKVAIPRIWSLVTFRKHPTA